MSINKGNMKIVLIPGRTTFPYLVTQDYTELLLKGHLMRVLIDHNHMKNTIPHFFNVCFLNNQNIKY